MNDNTERLLHRPRQVADMLGIGMTTFWVKVAPHLDLRKIGSATFATDDSVRRYIDGLPQSPSRRPAHYAA